jgi:hypothetical protein
VSGAQQSPLVGSGLCALVTLIAAHFQPSLEYVLRMMELETILRGFRAFLRSGRSLSDDSMAGLTIMADRATVFSLMKAVVTAHAADIGEMADVVRIYRPAGIHLREEVARLGLLHSDNRAVQLTGVCRQQFRVFAAIM